MWRYSRIDELDLDDLRPAGPGDTAGADRADLPADVQALLAVVGDAAGIVVVRNGRVVEATAAAGSRLRVGPAGDGDREV
ncbi:MAG TPA: hypothetical protein VGJ43_14430, partial [Acidimicrobiales bacterium]